MSLLYGTLINFACSFRQRVIFLLLLPKFLSITCLRDQAFEAAKFIGTGDLIDLQCNLFKLLPQSTSSFSSQSCLWIERSLVCLEEHISNVYKPAANVGGKDLWPECRKSNIVVSQARVHQLSRTLLEETWLNIYASGTKFFRLLCCYNVCLSSWGPRPLRTGWSSGLTFFDKVVSCLS